MTIREFRNHAISVVIIGLIKFYGAIGCVGSLVIKIYDVILFLKEFFLAVKDIYLDAQYFRKKFTPQ